MASISESLGLAKQHHQAGNLALAEEIYGQILQVDPEHAEATYLLGITAVQRVQYEKAIGFFNRAIALNPNLARCYNGLAEAYRGMGALDVAETHFRRALHVQPDNPEAHFGLGHLLYQRKELQEAESELRRALEIRPGDAMSCVVLGHTLKDQGALDEAATFYGLALHLRPALAAEFASLEPILKRLSPEPSTEDGATDLVLHSRYARHPLRCRPNSTDWNVFLQIYIQREYRCLEDVSEAEYIVDCGAYVGYSGAYLLSRYGNANLVAIEPDASNFRLLQENLRPYEPRARTIRSAIWSHPTNLVMSEVPYRDGREWSRQVRECGPEDVPQMVAVDLGTILKESGHDRISILKIDIERAELSVFSTNYESWIDRVDCLLIELHDAECARVFFDAISTARFEVSRSGELVVCKKQHPH